MKNKKRSFTSLNKFFLAIPFLVIAAILFFVAWGIRPQTPSSPDSKVYVAIEGEGKIVSFDPKTRKLVSEIDLSEEHDGRKLSFAPHNVQVSPDMKTVWVTANAGEHEEHSLNLVSTVYAHGEEEEAGEEPDEVIVINPLTDKIISRIHIEAGVHLAHIVLTSDNAYAYATAQIEGSLYKINAKTYKVEGKISLPQGSEPHGIRISPDDSFAYIAMLKGKSLDIVDLKTEQFSEVGLNGQAVQAGVTPDGRYALASVYDQKSLAVYQTDTKKLSYIKLPENAKGPVQMFPTPDSRFVYIADQGYYFEQPTSEYVYKIDLAEAKVVKEIKAGKAPHGIVVSQDGKFVYVTNLLSNDVSIIDTERDLEVGRIKVGKEPNGISIWYKR